MEKETEQSPRKMSESEEETKITREFQQEFHRKVSAIIPSTKEPVRSVLWGSQEHLLDVVPTLRQINPLGIAFSKKLNELTSEDFDDKEFEKYQKLFVGDDCAFVLFAGAVNLALGEFMNSPKQDMHDKIPVVIPDGPIDFEFKGEKLKYSLLKFYTAHDEEAWTKFSRPPALQRLQRLLANPTVGGGNLPVYLVRDAEGDGFGLYLSKPKQVQEEKTQSGRVVRFVGEARRPDDLNVIYDNIEEWDFHVM